MQYEEQWSAYEPTFVELQYNEIYEEREDEFDDVVDDVVVSGQNDTNKLEDVVLEHPDIVLY